MKNSSLLTRHEWTLFFLLYYVACAIDYVDSSPNTYKQTMLTTLNTWTSELLNN